MKLSQAIREGAKLRPQVFGTYKARVGRQWGTCAVGAAYEAVTGKLPPTEWLRPMLHDVLGPECGVSTQFLGTVSYRQDTLKQSREEIADWVELQGH